MHAPPKWLKTLLTWCCPPDRIDILGDFEEWYHDLVQEKGVNASRLFFLLQSLRMIPLKVISKKTTKRNIMLGFHFRLARRNLVKDKLYTIINASGLMVGIAVCTFIGLYIHDELSYDTHFEDYENIYRITGTYQQGGDETTHSTLTAYLLKQYMQTNIAPELIYTRLDFTEVNVRIGERSFWEDYTLAVDSNFFEVLSAEFIEGNAEAVLRDPQSVVLDRSTASKYFPDAGAMGQLLEIDGVNYVINGVIEDMPDNTHFEAHLFIPIAGIESSYPQWMTDTWGGVSHRTYFRVPDNYDVADLSVRLNESIATFYEVDKAPVFSVQAVKDIHLHSSLVAEIEANSSQRTLNHFLIIAVIILLLACINFINLSIASSLKRLKEVGVKKVLGATRRSQVTQFRLESLLIGFGAAILAVLLVDLLLPVFNSIAGKELVLSWETNAIILGLSLALVIFISFVVGSFPAMYLLKVPAAAALKGVTSARKGFNPRMVLVAVQFFLAAIIISSTLIILDQLTFMRTKDLGINTSQLISVPFFSVESMENYALLKEELLKQPSILGVTGSTSGLSNRVGGWRQYRTSAMAEAVNIPTVVADHDYFNLIEAEFVAGRDFSEDYPGDYTEAYIINEAAASFLELKNPVGEPLRGSAFSGSSWTNKDARIIGVVKDFHFASLHDKIRPVVFSLSSEITYPLTGVFVKLAPEGILQTLESVEKTWSAINPDQPIRYRFVDESIQEHYEQEARFFNVFSIFAILSIFIGCIGLFGLTAFMMKRRTKEIGIRKVLGASQLNLLTVLSEDFVRMVIIACVLGVPVTLWFMIQWLENFEYRITIGWWVFVLTAAGATLAAFLSIFYHSLKVSGANPIESIRYE